MLKTTHRILGSIAVGCLISTQPFASESLDIKKHWFDVPNSITYDKAESAVFVYDSSCTGDEIFDNRLSLMEAMMNTLALDVNLQPKSQTLFREYSRFWSFEEHYYQLTAVWDYDVPARYRLEFYKSPVPEMNQAIEQLYDSSFSSDKLYDALSVEEIMDTVLNQQLQKGAVKGAEILVSVITDQVGMGHEVTFLNSLPVSWAVEDNSCFMTSDFDTLQCGCDASATHQHAEGGVQ
ncbi:hypothetical protein [Marinicella sp. W31]|uniref:hypothetical protein n=1 Tax=Marinicella sp. W31 TaxID=3023713 RepID=UPI003756F801